MKLWRTVVLVCRLLCNLVTAALCSLRVALFSTSDARTLRVHPSVRPAQDTAASQPVVSPRHVALHVCRVSICSPSPKR